jgi:hypothetical protein
MNHSQTIGIDTAKRVFFLHGENAVGKVVLRQKLTREQRLPRSAAVCRAGSNRRVAYRWRSLTNASSVSGQSSRRRG